MNGSHVAAASGTTAMLTEIIYWALHWPLTAPDMNTCAALAGFAMIVLGGGGIAIFNKGSGNDADGNPPPPPIGTPAVMEPEPAAAAPQVAP